MPGLIQKFVSSLSQEKQKPLENSLQDLGYWRSQHQIISGLFYSNSLLRCFQQSKPRIQSAKALLNHLMQKKIYAQDRDIIMSSLPSILQCDYEPFSFQMLSKFFRRPVLNPEQFKTLNLQEVSFCQNIKNRDTIMFNDNREELTIMD
jgi:hypothetical protein